MSHKELVLEHYGVKGMRWGRRKGKVQLSREAKQRYTEKKPMISIKIFMLLHHSKTCISSSGFRS